MFDKISGYDNVKWALEAAIKADNPCHILLVGPPGIGKTRFLKAIESNYPKQSYFALGGGSSSAGMVDYLFENQPRFLLVDEIEDMKRTDQAMFKSLMQDCELIETKKVNTRKLEGYRCSIFATANGTDRIPPAVLSRFKVIHLQAYSREEFMKVAIEQIDADESFARYIANTVWNQAKNPSMRECFRIANMCRTPSDVQEYMKLENI